MRCLSTSFLLLFSLTAFSQAFTPLRPFILSSSTTSTNWNPTNNPLLKLWLKVDYGLMTVNGWSALTNGAPITMWSNAAPYATASQWDMRVMSAPADNTPLTNSPGSYYRTNGPSVQGTGLGSISGTNAFLALATGVNVTNLISAPCDIFIVFKASTTAATSRMILDAWDGNNMIRLDRYAPDPYFQFGKTLAPEVHFDLPVDCATNWTLLSIGVLQTNAPANCFVRTNGVLSKFGQVHDGGAIGSLVLNGDVLDTTPWSDHYLVEIMAYVYGLDTNQIRAVEGYLTNKWNLTNYYAP